MLSLLLVAQAATLSSTPFDDALKDYELCAVRMAEHFARETAEPLDIVADAALGACRDDAGNVFVQVIIKQPLTPEGQTYSRQAMDFLTADVRQTALFRAFQVRHPAAATR